MPRIKLTKSAIDALPKPGTDLVYWDTGLPGFGVKVTPKGRKVFLVLYRTGGAGSKLRKYTIGPYGRVTLHQARVAAQKVFAARLEGRDPAAERKEAKRKLVADRVEDVLETFIAQRLSQNRSGNEIARLLRRELVKTWGGRSIHDIGKQDVVDGNHRYGVSTPTQRLCVASRCRTSPCAALLIARRPGTFLHVVYCTEEVSSEPFRLGANQIQRKSVLQVGHNCWRLARAHRAAVLIDAEAYFAHLHTALQSACRTIYIAGWDFDGRIKLRPGDDTCLPLGPFLRQLVEEQPELTIRILVWSTAILHAPSATMPLLVGAEWQDHPRIALKLDREHPIYASHHQKIVVVDDRLAFCGGIDLTVTRWDTPDHRPDNPLRVDPDGVAYGQTHDIQMMVDGDAAGALSEIVRDRWRRTCGEDLNTNACEPAENPWPRTCTPHFRDVTIAVARTMPAWRGSNQIEEISALTRDLLLAAEERIYIEAQYFCARELRAIFERILSQPTGPEIVAIVGRNGEGPFEHWVMGRNRNGMIRHLNSLDRYQRLNIYCPVVEGPDGDRDIAIHAKFMTIDDAYLRVGSANLNNRSMGLDTECDLVVVAEDKAARATIAQFRSRLLAEHLGAHADDVAAAVEERGMSAAIERLNISPRRLRTFRAAARRGSVHSVPGTAFLDPRRPLGLNWSLSRSIKA